MMQLTRQELSWCFLFFVLGCMILSALTELIYVTGKQRVVLYKSTEGSNVIEGDFSPVPAPEKTE